VNYRRMTRNIDRICPPRNHGAWECCPRYGDKQERRGQGLRDEQTEARVSGSEDRTYYFG
jgi:hypothetical protein